jgi:hypothetical protein
MKIRRDVAPFGRRTWRTVVCLGIAATCSTVGLSAGPALASPEQDPVVVGDASPIEAGVEVRGGANAPFVLLETVEPVAVGDGVRTDTTGFAEIAYFDGSRTRLDIDTECEVVELVNDAGVSVTRTSMGVGRTWHRVESLGEGEFTVETSQATATVRGTAFVLACETADSCTYVVFEGIIELTLADGTVVEVIGPAEVAVLGGVAGPVTPVTLDRLLSDPWLLTNANRDIAAGFGDLVEILGATEVTTTTELSTTSTTTPDTSTTTTPPTSTTEPSSSTTETSTSTTEGADSTTTTTEQPNEPATSTTTTVRPTEQTTSTTSTTTTTTEPPPSTSTTTTSTTTTTTEPPPSTSTTTTSTTTTTTEPPPSTSTTTTSTTTTSTTTSTTTTTQPPTTTTTIPPRGTGICHRVSGAGNTGNGYNYLVVHPLIALIHQLLGHGDLIPAPNASCKSEAATAVASAASVPPSTTTTTTALELVTVSARPVIESASADTPALTPPPKVARTPFVAPATTTPATVPLDTTAPVETTAPAETTLVTEPTLTSTETTDPAPAAETAELTATETAELTGTETAELTAAVDS